MAIPDPITLLVALNHTTTPPDGINVAARDLSQEQARDLCVYYALNNLLSLEKPITFGKDAKPTWPKVGDRSTLGLTIGGVHFSPDNTAAAGLTRTGRMDLRTAVLAVRLARYLRSNWATNTLQWGGMGFGRDPNDRHGRGLAIDIHGVLGPGAYFRVSRDWGKKPITLPNGTKAHAWPNNQRPYFRLDVDTSNGRFFYELYKFLTGEAADAPRPSSIGDRSYILCPDMPDNYWRPLHQDHIHCEVDR
jgi:hypothetical protein